MYALFLAAILTADDPAWLVDYARLVKSEATTDVKEATAALAKLKKSRVNPRAFGINKKGEEIFRNAEAKRNAIAREQKKLTRAKEFLSGELSYFPVLHSLTAGSCGRLYRSTVKSIQVTSASSALIEFLHEQQDDDGSLFQTKVTVLLETDVSGWTDGQSYEVIMPVRVTGTTRYQTVLGSSKTVYRLQTWTVDDLRRFLELVSASDEKPK